MCYRLAFRKRKIAKTPKRIFGVQTANNGGAVEASASTPKTLSKNTKPKARIIPIARFIPIPPRRFMEETETAIIVKINAETGILYFLYNTTKYVLILEEPLSLSLSIKLFNSPNESVSAT